MHMTDSLLSATVGITMCAISGSAIAYSTTKMKNDELSEKKLPIMAVAGAFVFAAQMVNFTIPATGSSGHIGGGMLLAALLGGFPALLAISTVIIIQCLFFADGGLLALGCNIFNLGIVPCLIVYPLIFKPLTKKGFTTKNLTIASVVSVIISLQLGALSVVLQTLLSGISILPFSNFVMLMQPIHLAIGIVEGIVSASVLCFVFKMRPEILVSTMQNKKITSTVYIRKVMIAFCVITLILAGGLSIFASVYPDGLEWSIQKVAGTTQLETSGEIQKKAATIQENLSFMPDYSYATGDQSNSNVSTSVAGIFGSLITFILAGAIGLFISFVKKKKKSSTAL